MFRADEDRLNAGWYELLGREISCDGAEAKYFLVQLLRDRHWLGLSKQDVEYWVSRFGMTARAVGLAIRELSAAGYIYPKVIASGKRGKPARAMEVCGSVNDLLAMSDGTQKNKNNRAHDLPPPPPLWHGELIDQLLEPDLVKGFDAPRFGSNGRAAVMAAKRHKLGLAGRLLLAVLLRFADEYGVVRCLGRSELSRLTGMSKERLSSQLDCLQKEGYLYAVVAGVSTSGLIRVGKGAFFLNLKHSAYAAVALRGPSILFAEKGVILRAHIRYGERLVEAARIISEAATRRDQIIPFPEFAAGVCDRRFGSIDGLESIDKFYSGFFCPEMCPATFFSLKKYMQMKVEQYAGLMLSEYLVWGREMSAAKKNEFLYNVIQGDFLSVTNRNLNASIKYSEWFMEFSKAILFFSTRTAEIAKKIILSSGFNVKYGDKIIILPMEAYNSVAQTKIRIEIISRYRENEINLSVNMINHPAFFSNNDWYAPSVDVE
jgi:hypothetical protein